MQRSLCLLLVLAITACDATKLPTSAGDGPDAGVQTVAASPGPAVAPAETFVVTNTLDADPAPPGSLREAIDLANATVDLDVIEFDIDPATDPGCDAGTGRCTIGPIGRYNVIRPLIINGPAQAADFDPPAIILDGSVAPTTSPFGMVVHGVDFEIRWMTFNNFQRDLRVNSPEFVIEHNFLGTTPGGDASIVPPNLGNASSLDVSSGTGRIQKNVFGGNHRDPVKTGILLFQPDNVEIRDNRLGVDRTGEFFIGGGSIVQLGDGGGGPGGGHTIEENVIAGRGHMISLRGSGGNVVRDNYIGSGLSASAPLPGDVRQNTEPVAVVLLSDANLVEDNVIASHRGVRILCCDPSGNDPDGNVIRANFFGADRDGNTIGTPHTRAQAILIDGGHDNVIGGASLVDGNLIANYRRGVHLRGQPTIPGSLPGYEILNNDFRDHGLHAIEVSWVSADLEIIGNSVVRSGLGSGFPRPGIVVFGDIAGPTTIIDNAVHSNAGIGIDLGNDGHTDNDATCDSDAGPNGLQNYPEITRAVSGGSTTIVTGRLFSEANATYRIQLFGNTTGGFEGETRVTIPAGDDLVTTDGDCMAEFSFVLNFPLPVGTFVTATATSLAGDGATSEFSFAKDVEELTPEEQLRELVGLVEALIPSELRRQDANGLLAKLREAEKKLLKGQVDVVLNALHDFIDQVAALENSRRLSEEAASDLRNAAQLLIDRLEGGA